MFDFSSVKGFLNNAGNTIQEVAGKVSDRAQQVSKTVGEVGDILDGDQQLPRRRRGPVPPVIRAPAPPERDEETPPDQKEGPLASIGGPPVVIALILGIVLTTQ